ncbi:D-alanyl-lipoteichoic acid biosynthesis protein DltB, partial [Enterococcus faecalis]
YVIYQTLLTWGYAAYRKNKNARCVFYLAVFLAILPLVCVKVSPFMTGKTTLLGFLGISYLTFTAVQVVMYLRDGVLIEYHPLQY